MIGKEIGNHRILKELGRGGMGVVYKANQLSLSRIVAMKVLPQHLTSDPAFIKRFENEARAIAKLNHPNIVQIYDISHEDQLYYYTMEFVEGVPLDEIIYKEGFLPLERAVNIVVQVAKALQYAHSQGIVHRDIKPSNIMIDKSSRVKVTDFGLALQERTTRLTMDGGIVGTPEYMSPEQAAGQTATSQSDIYSLGVVFYELLTGKVPFEAESPLKLLNKIQKSDPEWPRTINPDIPVQVEKVIQTMMAKNPRDRYASCQEAIQDFRLLKTGQAVVARPKRRNVPMIAAISLLVFAALMGGGLFFLKRAGTAPLSPASQSTAPAVIPQAQKPQPIPAVTAASQPQPSPAPASKLPDNSMPSTEQQISKIDKDLSLFEEELESIMLEKPPPKKMWPDEITLKKGSKIMICDITGETPEKIRIRTDVVSAEIARNEIQLITYATPEEKENARALRATEQERLEEERRLKNKIDSLTKERARLQHIIEDEGAADDTSLEPNASAPPSSWLPAHAPSPTPVEAEKGMPADGKATSQSLAGAKKEFVEIPLVEENWTAAHSCDQHANILFDNGAISIASDSRIGSRACTTTVSTVSPIEGIPDTIELLVQTRRIMTSNADRAIFSFMVNFASGSSIEYCLFDSRDDPTAPEIAETDEGIRIRRPELLGSPNEGWITVVLPLTADIAKIRRGERIADLALVCKHAGPTAGTTMFQCKAIILNWK